MTGDYVELGLYVFILGMIVQSVYRILDPFLIGIKNTFVKFLTLIKVIKPKKEDFSDQAVRYDRSGKVNNFSNESYKVDEGGSYYTPVEEVNVGGEFADYRDRKPIEKKPTWQDLIVPPIIGLAVAFLFYPLTIFDYLPFQPQYPYVAYVVTALTISRIANAEHNTFKQIGEFFIGLTGKLFYR